MDKRSGFRNSAESESWPDNAFDAAADKGAIPEERARAAALEKNIRDLSDAELLGVSKPVEVNVHGRTRYLPVALQFLGLKGKEANAAARALFQRLNERFFDGREKVSDLLRSEPHDDDANEVLRRAMLRLYGVPENMRLSLFGDHSAGFESQLTDAFQELVRKFDKERIARDPETAHAVERMEHAGGFSLDAIFAKDTRLNMLGAFTINGKELSFSELLEGLSAAFGGGSVIPHEKEIAALSRNGEEGLLSKEARAKLRGIFEKRREAEGETMKKAA